MQEPGVVAVRQALEQRRLQAFQQFRQQRRPETLLTALRKAVDQAIHELLRLFPLPAGATLAAVGGYGRGELYPYSDIDILILLRKPPSDEEASGIESLIAALWDLGLDLGHSVRTLEQCQEEAANDVTVETSLLESRWLAGDLQLLRELIGAMRGQLDPQRFFQAKRIEMQQRHVRYHGTPYALEPNCKESPGGLRDLQIIQWLAQAAGLGNNWREIARTDLLTASEFRSLRKAELAFKRLRIELHLLAGRREDRVLFDLQPRLAEVYGFTGSRTRRASELLMQRYYWAARVVSQFHTILLQSIEEILFLQPDAATTPIDEHFQIRNNRLELCRDDGFERNPSLIFRSFLILQQRRDLQGMSARMLHAMWHARRHIDSQFRRNPVNQHHFLQILQQPQGVVHTLRRMSLLNILPRYLPVFRRVVGQMQHDLFHAYTVDEHTLMVIRNIRRFTLAEYAQEHPLATELMAGFDRHWLLYVAALFHDIAKGRGGDHSELGARDIRRFCIEHRLDPADAELVEFLVRHHLKLSSVAQKQDLSDPRVIRDFATLMRDERHLTALYLLTVADIRGTSPKVWNAWKGKLLENLYRQTLQALGSGKLETADLLAQRKDAAIAEIRRLGLSDDSRDRFWSQLDVAYFLRHDVSDIAWQTRHLYRCVNSPEPVVKTRILGQHEALQVMVYIRDRKDLFVSICQYFDARMISIQDAKIHTTAAGWALDTFIVMLPAHEKDYRSHAALIEHELAQCLQHMSQPPSDGAPAGRRRESRQAKAFPIVPNAELVSEDNGMTWRLSVSAADRPGLLYQLARVFARHEAILVMAKIMTLGDRVEDVFILRGKVFLQPRFSGLFERDILAALLGDAK